MVSVLDLFEPLVVVDTEERLAAIVALLRWLYETQQAHRKALGTQWTTLNAIGDVKERLGKLLAEDVMYALERLMKGLPSTRLNAREGFTVALRELLHMLDVLTLNYCLDRLLAHTQVSGGMKSGEESEILFGRLVGLSAIIDSDLVERSTTKQEDVQQLIDVIIELSQKRSYLTRPCMLLLGRLATKPSNKGLSRKMAAYIVKKELASGIRNANQLYLALLLKQPSGKALLKPDHLSDLALILKDESFIDQEDTVHQKNWQANLHPAWNAIFDQYTDDSAFSDMAPFEELWRTCVDDTLFHHQASQGRKLWGFKAAELVLQKVTPDQIKHIFTRNMMRTLINNLASEHAHLHSAAQHFLSVLTDTLTSDDTVMTCVAELEGPNGNLNFDTLTKTTVVMDLLAKLSTKGMEQYCKNLQSLFVNGAAASKLNAAIPQDTLRRWVCDRMIALIRHPKLSRSETWIASSAKFLLFYAFFDVKSAQVKVDQDVYVKCQPALSAKTRTVCQARFSSVLADLSALQPLFTGDEQAQFRPSRVTMGSMTNQQYWATYFIQFYMTLRINTKAIAVSELSPEAQTTLEAAYTKLNQILNSLHTNHDVHIKTFELLLSNLVVEILLDPEEAIGNADEVMSAYDKFCAQEKIEADDEEDLRPVDVILDMLISFLAKPSALWKRLAEQTFAVFSGMYTKDSLDLILNALQGLDEAIEEEDDDVEAMDVDNVDIEGVSSEYSEEEEEEEEEEEKAYERDENAQLQAKLDKMDQDDEESEDLSDLDDEQMLAYDEKLSEIFRQRRLDKANRKEIEQSKANFQVKLLDLLQIYINKQSDSELVLDLIGPLFETLDAKYPQVVTSKATRILSMFTKPKAYPKRADPKHVESIKTIVLSLQKKGSNNQVKKIAELITQRLEKLLEKSKK
ncbi:hypothetical protein BZG36_02672 [Bifiguratus adelaidae]|uniref:TonB C-terminal domain-containing protein n=1 Tax=Bifiguratus adelaidae TaxID=1938954 RepID=A0A261Y1U6_9FUNG|nr:hypothetical protein BZG36_02672 [Bifiguratus adelaidae]